MVDLFHITICLKVIKNIISMINFKLRGQVFYHLIQKKISSINNQDFLTSKSSNNLLIEEFGNFFDIIGFNYVCLNLLGQIFGGYHYIFHTTSGVGMKFFNRINFLFHKETKNKDIRRWRFIFKSFIEYFWYVSHIFVYL